MAFGAPIRITAYPFVNKAAYREGQCVYQRMDTGEVVDVMELPQVHVHPDLMPLLDGVMFHNTRCHRILDVAGMLGNRKRLKALAG